MQKHEAQNLSDNEFNKVARSHQDNETGKWFFSLLTKSLLIIWLFTYGEPDLLHAMIQFLINYR